MLGQRWRLVGRIVAAAICLSDYQYVANAMSTSGSNSQKDTVISTTPPLDVQRNHLSLLQFTARNAQLRAQNEKLLSDDQHGNGSGDDKAGLYYQTLKKYLPSHDALAVSKWHFVTSAFENLGKEAERVVRVQDDLTAMRDSLIAQQSTWEKGTKVLEDDNKRLKMNRDVLAQKVATGSRWKSVFKAAVDELWKQQKNLALIHEKHVARAAAWQAEEQALNRRVQKLEELQNQTYAVAKQAMQSLGSQAQQNEALMQQDKTAILAAKMELDDFQLIQDTTRNKEQLARAKLESELHELEAQRARLALQLAYPKNMEDGSAHAVREMHDAKQELATLRSQWGKNFHVKQCSVKANEVSRLKRETDILKKRANSSKLELDSYCAATATAHNTVVAEMRNKNCNVEDDRV